MKEFDRVVHKEFGEGYIVAVIDNRAIVDFEEIKTIRNVFMSDIELVYK